MNAKDISVWVRIYGYEGESQDIQFKPLTYNSFDDWQDHWNETLEVLGMADFEYVDWDYVYSESEAANLLQDEATWDAWIEYLDMYGNEGDKLFNAALSNYSGDMSDFPSWMEEAYMGEWDSMLDYAYDLLDDIGIDEKTAENYFDYESFGFALKANGDLSAIIMDDWEDRYDTEAEAQAVYDEMYDMRDDELAEWYIYDLVGDLESALGDKVKDFFDYQKFARDLEYDYDYTNGYIFSRNV